MKTLKAPLCNDYQSNYSAYDLPDDQRCLICARDAKLFPPAFVLASEKHTLLDPRENVGSWQSEGYYPELYPICLECAAKIKDIFYYLMIPSEQKSLREMNQYLKELQEFQSDLVATHRLWRRYRTDGTSTLIHDIQRKIYKTQEEMGVQV